MARERESVSRGILVRSLSASGWSRRDLTVQVPGVQSVEGVVAVRIGRGGTHDVAVLYEQLHGDADVSDVARKFSGLVAVLAEVQTPLRSRAS